jgi:hypothetical protein
MTHRVRGGFVWPIYIADAQGESRTRDVMARAERKENKVNYGCYKSALSNGVITRLE